MTDTVYIRRVKKGLSKRTKRRRYRAQKGYSKKQDPDFPKIKHWEYIKDVYDKGLNKDFKGAEKTVLKLFKKDPNNKYVISKLISMYTSWDKLVPGESDRLDEAEEICELALKWGICDSSVATAVITLYGAIGKFDKAWAVFENAVSSGFADAPVYNSMMSICMDKPKYAEIIFDMAKKNSIVHMNLYNKLLAIYYKNGKYTEAEEVINNSPQAIKNSPQIRLEHFELQRKLKKYEKTIEEIDDFLSLYKDEKFHNEDYVHARTIKAYCMMHCGRKDEAIDEFSILKKNVEKTNTHYPRIICGFTFCKSQLTETEREDLLADLDFFGLATGRSMKDKIDNAIKIIEGQEEKTG